MPESEDVVVTYESDIVRLKLNRPKQLNALNESIRATIAATLNDLMERPDIRLLVITGEGKSFCSGAELILCSHETESFSVRVSGRLEPGWAETTRSELRRSGTRCFLLESNRRHWHPNLEQAKVVSENRTLRPCLTIA